MTTSRAWNTTVRMTLRPHGPTLPHGGTVDLPGRGTTFYREAGAHRAGLPSLLLLHGWTASADLNWGWCYEPLAETHHVVALDHRGHSRGIHDDRRFELEDCADDAAALVETLGLERVVAVGYSMGGPVAQLLWRRHPHLVDGLVLCATSRTFNDTVRERALFGLLAGAGATARRLSPARRARLAMRVMAARRTDASTWAWAADDLSAHSWLRIVEAGRSIGRFDSRAWASSIDVPTGVVVTMDDAVVPARRQWELAAAIPGATVHPVAGDHAVCLAHPDELLPALQAAVGAVTDRLHAAPEPLAA
jgi:3-oxoadipate enol-lactonase